MRHPFNIKKLFIFISCFIALFFIAQLECNNFKFKTPVYSILWIGLPFWVSRRLPKEATIKTIAIVFGIFGYFLLTLYFMLIYIIGFCAWGKEERLLYINKKNNSVSLVARGYSCYGTTEDFTLFKEHKLTEHLKWVTEFTGNPKDTTEWREIH